ncbi:transcriptional regulator [Pantoea sp. DY-15]|uniref:winged helix-turn-helix domain-containing protein n=1 Tax=unclassified Pantoea TaxID=2630326 RepID=UPI001C95FCC0|nr:MULTISPECIES: transcriptional regulator [unclassified Pantoea]MBY4838421.1 transcriptional regulator [Pantoea sp. DY-5]MBY4890017.1 transcriptional regulator [Pantoea sp. DY-15]
MTSDCIINHWLLDIASASLIHQKSGEQRRLGEYQLKLLVVLIQHAGQILSREELNQLVWERRVIGSNSLPNAIHALRIALEDDGKQQLIIKTVPKKGYILEAEFCHFQRRINEEDEEESSVQLLTITPSSSMPAEILQVSHESLEMPDTASSPSATVINPPPQVESSPGWIALFGLTLVIFLMLAGWVLQSALHDKPQMAEIPIEGVTQIRLLHLTKTPLDISSLELDTSKQISDTLRQLNTTLKERNVRMDIYYSATGSAVNLTLNLNSTCAHQQLAMAIFNATENPQALNQLLTEETERKLNEMAPCNS